MKRFRVRDQWCHNPAYQWIGERQILCLLCARVVSTNGRAKAAHEKGIEHRSALAEMGRRAS